MKITIDQNLHKQMKEVSRRRKRETGLTIGGFYAQALQQFHEKQRVPKKVEVINRRQFRFDVPIGLEDILQDFQLLAWKQRVSLSAILEQAIAEYLAKPENYLGDRFMKSIQKEFYDKRNHDKRDE